MNKHSMQRAWLMASLLSLAGMAHAVPLEIPEHLNVISLNGEEQSSSLFIRTSRLELPMGMISLKVIYRDLIESDRDDSHETVRSEPVTLHFEAVNSDEPYKLIAPRPDNLEDAHVFARKPSIHISHHQQTVQLVEPVYISSSSPSSSAQAPSPSQAASMLDYWWQQADSETRATFLKKVSTQ